MNINQFKNHCCGCGECYEICPFNAITFEKDAKGFYQPHVDVSKCTNCGLCIKHCSFNTDLSSNTVISAYAVKHEDELIRAVSRSGGVFTALTDEILLRGGVVYGCVLQDCREAVHIRATRTEERNTMRGSKYIQSNIQPVYKLILEDLKNERWVLFSGTPCQVAAVADYCNGFDEKLILVDIVCHSVPSQKVWEDYLAVLAKKNRSSVVSVDFRDKVRFGWAEHKETIQFSNGYVYSGESFKQLFSSHYIDRESCFDCPYKTLHRVGDITIADCWGISKIHPEFVDDRGISLVMLNTKKGDVLFRQAKQLNSLPVDVEQLLQPALKENWQKPARYEEFWDIYHRKGFLKTMSIFFPEKEKFSIRIKVKIAVLLKKIKKENL